MDCHATDVTKQFKTTITIHLTSFISCIIPEIPWSCVTGLGAPILQEEATLIMCNIGILQITRIHFTRNLLSASPVLQVRYNAAPILNEVYTKLSSSTKGPLIPGASSPMLSTLNDSP